MQVRVLPRVPVPVVQWIEHLPSKQNIRVRFSAGAPYFRDIGGVKVELGSWIPSLKLGGGIQARNRFNFFTSSKVGLPYECDDIISENSIDEC